MFVQHDDGVVTMTWKRAPLRGRTVALAAEEVTDVVAEFSRVRPSKATVVVVTKNARIPLSQADSDGHESTLPQVSEFFGLALPAEAGA